MDGSHRMITDPLTTSELRSATNLEGCQTVAGGHSAGLQSRADLRLEMPNAPQRGARTGARHFGFNLLQPFDTFRYLAPFRVRTCLGPVPGVSRGTAVPRSTPG